MRLPRRSRRRPLPWRHLRGAAVIGMASLVSGCAAWGWFGALWPGGDATLGADFGYGALPGQSLDLHGPAASGQARPVLLLLHGSTGSGPRRQDYAFVGEALADYHLLVAVPDYGTEAVSVVKRARAAAARIRLRSAACCSMRASRKTRAASAADPPSSRSAN